VLGEALTADIQLGEGLKLLLEHGIGAKTEVIPFVDPARVPPPPRVPYLPEQGPVPQGSTFVHHAHAAVEVGDWLMLGAHYLNSWSPNDYFNESGRAPTASLTVIGAEVHVDSEVNGHGYIGFSHVDAEDILPLADGVEVLHARNGLQFTDNYFNPVADAFFGAAPPRPLPLDTGTVDNVLFQYLLRLAPLLGWSDLGPDLRLAVFGMFNRISTDELKQNRLKWGAEVSVRPLKYLSGGVRFDSVMPDGPNDEAAYHAISPRLVLHSNWINREYIMLSYTRYFYGEEVVASPPYDALRFPDPNMVILSAAVAF
jgi:hypothetical protein